MAGKSEQRDESRKCAEVQRDTNHRGHGLYTEDRYGAITMPMSSFLMMQAPAAGMAGSFLDGQACYEEIFAGLVKTHSITDSSD